MRRSLLAAALLVCLGALSATSQPAGHPPISPPGGGGPLMPPEARPEDVASLDAIIGSFYAASSAGPQQARNWDRLHSLFVAEGRFCAARPAAEGGAGVLIMPVADYIAFNRTYFEKGGFVEREVARRVEEFGNIAQVWSTYETRRRAEDAEPYSRGIYSIQLLKTGPRWAIVNVYWDFERPDNPLPARYLESPRP